jgi:hypothetical protein
MTSLVPKTVVTATLRPGDQIITTDLLKATVTFVDARDPRIGPWIVCVTEDGRTLRFAARTDQAVTRLRPGTASLTSGPGQGGDLTPRLTGRLERTGRSAQF